MKPCGIGVITKLPYELIKIQAVFDIVEDFRIGHAAEDISIQVQSAALAMLRSRRTTQGSVEFRGPVPRGDVDRDFKVISERLKDMLCYKFQVCDLWCVRLIF